jgi:Protein tyrosine and serine/threonine kinase
VYAGLYSGNDCVVKELLQADASTKDAATIVEEKRREMLQEAWVMAKIRPHGSIMVFYGVCFNPLRTVAELVSGGELKKLLERSHISALDGVSLSRDLASGLSHLQRFRVMHCDGMSIRVCAAENRVCDLNDMLTTGMPLFLTSGCPQLPCPRGFASASLEDLRLRPVTNGPSRCGVDRTGRKHSPPDPLELARVLD